MNRTITKCLDYDAILNKDEAKHFTIFIQINHCIGSLTPTAAAVKIKQNRKH